MTTTAPSALRDLLLDPDAVVLFDGAMGTMLHAHGIPLNLCYDELNVRSPELVLGVHRDYVAAGADVIETNTYGANRHKLGTFGLESRVGELNAAAAVLARRAADEVADRRPVWVAGTVGPLGLRIEPYGPTARGEARAMFEEQLAGLVEGGCDVVLLETFGDLHEIEQAVLAARAVAPHLPVIAQMTVGDDLRAAYGAQPEDIARALAQMGADVVGLNCSVGPQRMLEAVERMVGHSGSAAISAMPNAGLPHEVVGLRAYVANPEYLATFARHLVHAGARIVGGCCGTTPAHTRAMAQALRAERAMSRSAARAGSEGADAGAIGVDGEIVIGASTGTRAAGVATIRVDEPSRDVAAGPAGVEAVALGDRSRLGSKLASGEFVATVELVPPRGVDVGELVRDAVLLRTAGVDAINVPDGPRAQSRMGAIATSLVVLQQAGIEAVTHYCCRDRNLLGMLSDLLGASALGLHNLLVITGDPPKMGPYPDATAVFDVDSIGLVNMVAALNRGLDPGGNELGGTPTQFTIGVGVNPGAVDVDEERRRYAWKLDAGADYAISQPVFDVAQLEAWLTATETETVPLVAGLWPLVSARNAEFLANEVPGVTVPDAVLKRMRAASERSREHAVEEGLAIAREMYAVVRPMVQGVQVSAPFGRVALAMDVFAPGDLVASPG